MKSRKEKCLKHQRADPKILSRFRHDKCHQLRSSNSRDRILPVFRRSLKPVVVVVLLLVLFRQMWESCPVYGPHPIGDSTGRSRRQGTVAVWQRGCS